jgi:hypothetical protein
MLFDVLMLATLLFVIPAPMKNRTNIVDKLKVDKVKADKVKNFNKRNNLYLLSTAAA